MAHFRSPTSVRQTRDSTRLVTLAQALARSGSRVEDRYWEHLIEQILTRLLRTGNDAPLEAALTRLADESDGYEVLVEQAETLSESATLAHAGGRYDALLIVVPIAAWTRYSIPTGVIATAHLEALTNQMHGHVLAANARLAFLPQLLSIDQMPRSFSETWQWLQRLAQQALGTGPARLDLPDETEVAELLADTRYVVGVVLAEEGQPLFRWQEAPGRADAERSACEKQWLTQIEPTLARLLPGCGVECLLPDAYYVSNRAADQRVRPLALQAAVAWLESALGIPASQVRAVIAACGEGEAEEYRIGLTLRQSNEVLYGCVWPVYERTRANGDADDANGPAAEIAERLKTLGVTDIRRLAGILPAEFCEDSNAPYFPNPLGEMVHAEIPEHVDADPGHFH